MRAILALAAAMIVLAMLPSLVQAEGCVEGYHLCGTYCCPN